MTNKQRGNKVSFTVEWMICDLSPLFSLWNGEWEEKWPGQQREIELQAVVG